jgi:hypothetical protein
MCGAAAETRRPRMQPPRRRKALSSVFSCANQYSIFTRRVLPPSQSANREHGLAPLPAYLQRRVERVHLAAGSAAGLSRRPRRCPAAQAAARTRAAGW